MSAHCSSGSCSSGCHSVVPCPCPDTGNPTIDSLEKVLNCYWQNHQDLAVERDYYEALESLTIAIDEAAQALGDENLDPERPDVIPKKVLAEAAAKLSASEERLAACVDFDGLLSVVQQAIGSLAGISPSLVYLTALRIGLQMGRYPDRIYLDAGARAGCASLVDLGVDDRTLQRDRLPRIFQHPELPTEDVQSCLAICRHQLRWLKENDRS